MPKSPVTLAESAEDETKIIEPVLPRLDELDLLRYFEQNYFCFIVLISPKLQMIHKKL